MTCVHDLSTLGCSRGVSSDRLQSANSMRDIREDLRHRLTKIAVQRGELRSRLAWLDEVEAHIKALVEYERAQVEFDQPALFTDDSLEAEQSAIGKFVREALSDLRPRTLDELKATAQERGMAFGDKNPGRVLHFALVGMKQNGIVDRDTEGRWRLLSESGEQAVM